MFLEISRDGILHRVRLHVHVSGSTTKCARQLGILFHVELRQLLRGELQDGQPRVSGEEQEPRDAFDLEEETAGGQREGEAPHAEFESGF